MPVRVTCPHCQTVHTLPDDIGSKQMACSQCRQEFTIDAAAPLSDDNRRRAMPWVVCIALAVMLVLAVIAFVGIRSLLRQHASRAASAPGTLHEEVAREQPKSDPAATPASRAASAPGTLHEEVASQPGGVSPRGDPAAAAHVDIKPAPASRAASAPGKEELLLSSGPGIANVCNVCVGGGGRYLILHLPDLRQLAVFDANEARIVKRLPVDQNIVQFAAGLDKLFVALPASNIIQRWDLKTLEREAVMPATVPIKRLAMGSATQEPLIAQTGDEGTLVFIDPLTLKKSDYFTADDGADRRERREHRTGLRVSANGQVITGGPVLVRVGRTYQPVAMPDSVLPGPDGRVLYDSSQLYAADGKPLGPSFAKDAQIHRFLPALHGPFALSFNEKEPAGRRIQSYAGQDKDAWLGVHLAGELKEFASLPEIEGLSKLVDWRLHIVQPLDQHLFLIPDAKLLVFIPVTNDKLVLLRRC